jgi:hypothetical protein
MAGGQLLFNGSAVVIDGLDGVCEFEEDELDARVFLGFCG